MEKIELRVRYYKVACFLDRNGKEYFNIPNDSTEITLVMCTQEDGREFSFPKSLSEVPKGIKVGDRLKETVTIEKA